MVVSVTQIWKSSIPNSVGSCCTVVIPDLYLDVDPRLGPKRLGIIDSCLLRIFGLANGLFLCQSTLSPTRMGEILYT